MPRLTVDLLTAEQRARLHWMVSMSSDGPVSATLRADVTAACLGEIIAHGEPDAWLPDESPASLRAEQARCLREVEDKMHSVGIVADTVSRLRANLGRFAHDPIKLDGIRAEIEHQQTAGTRLSERIGWLSRRIAAIDHALLAFGMDAVDVGTVSRVAAE